MISGVANQEFSLPDFVTNIGLFISKGVIMMLNVKELNFTYVLDKEYNSLLNFPYLLPFPRHNVLHELNDNP